MVAEAIQEVAQVPKNARYAGFKLKDFLALPFRLQQAITWARTSYGPSWKKKILAQPDRLPERLQAFHWHPFGYGLWNENLHIIRRYFAWRGEYDYKPCPYCAPDSGCPAQIM